MSTAAANGLHVLTLRPRDLLEPVPAWETQLEPGAVAAAIVDGAAPAWSAAAEADVGGRALAELRATPALTVAVVREGHVALRAQALVHACDLVVRDRRNEDADDALERLLGAVERAGPPALVAAQLLRAGARVSTESFAYSMLLGGERFLEWRRATEARDDLEERAARVEVEESSDAWLIRLTRPRRHNAYDARMREELCDALDAVASAGGRPVAIVGDGPSFCSGGDLDEFGLARDPVSAHLVRLGRSVARRLERIADRLVVGVHGHCIGAGVELAAFARVLLAARETSFRLPELSLGLSLGAGGSVSIPRRIGRHRTLELLLDGAAVDAEAARAWGLVDGLVAREQLEQRCLAAAVELS